jgi:hypothetical protein
LAQRWGTHMYRTVIAVFLLFATSVWASANGDEKFAGAVLPFHVIRAIGNPVFQTGTQAQVDISVVTGTPGDWMATAVEVAKVAVAAAYATSALVTVVRENPWGADPPQRPKELAKAYYAPYAPDPARSPWEKKWGVFLSKHFPSLPEIEFFIVSNDYLEKTSMRDPDLAQKKADDAARRAVIRKYVLSAKWQPPDMFDMGYTTEEYDASQVQIVSDGAAKPSLQKLVECLRPPSSGSGRVWGCREP